MTRPKLVVEARSCAPPRPPFALNLGVTGHRCEQLGANVAAVGDRVEEVVQAITAAAVELYGANAGWFADCPPAFTIVSPLADGADQIAAEAALGRGFALQAVLPFSRAEHRADFTEPDGLARYEALLARAASVLELPGAREHSLDAYVMAGRATVAHCDILIAVWDGLPQRGRGGTGEVVELAMARGTPVVHIPVDPAEPPTILWSAFDPAIVSVNSSIATRRRFDTPQIERLLALILAPPEDARERDDLRYFLDERDRKVRARVEYPLLLAATGTRRFKRGDWQAAPGVAATATEWTSFRESCDRCHGVAAELDLLEQAYAWSDRLAAHFAQNYRSGHILNFLFAALAVLTALTALFIPEAKPVLATAEFVLILTIMVNTHFGVKKRWHQRWLDYRQLAERLRPMRSLKLLGIAAPDPPGSATEPIARRWTDWYAAGVWRTMGCPAGRFDATRATTLSQAISRHEIAPQIAYHRSNAGQVERLDRRLELLGSALFAATLGSIVVLLITLVAAPDWAHHHFVLFVWLSAGLPALGTAIFGIRVQGDFCGSALRSHSTADRLERIAEDFAAAGHDLTRSADLAEQAARVMLADLGEWRLVNQQHELAVG